MSTLKITISDEQGYVADEFVFTYPNNWSEIQASQRVQQCIDAQRDMMTWLSFDEAKERSEP